MPHSQMYFFGQEVVSLTRLTSDDTYLTCTPLFHGNAQFMAAYPAFVAGAAVVVRPKFSASRWVDHLRENNVTVTNLIGVMMDFVWKAAPRPDDTDNSLRCVYSAPTASSVLKQFMARFDIEAFVDAFGLTETCAPILSPYGEIRPPGAAGLVASDWFEIRLVDPETDREVPTGEIGELVVRYKQPWTCSLGYYGMPEKTVEAWRNLWFHTGDALRRDADGWYYFVDRYKDALRRRGENISSYEVEQALLGHPAVAECAVIGVPADVDAGRGRGAGRRRRQRAAQRRRAVGLLPGQDPGLRGSAFRPVCRRPAQDTLGEGAEGGAARQRSDRGHPRPDGVGRPLMTSGQGGHRFEVFQRGNELFAEELDVGDRFAG